MGPRGSCQWVKEVNSGFYLLKNTLSKGNSIGGTSIMGQIASKFTVRGALLLQKKDNKRFPSINC